MIVVGFDGQDPQLTDRFMREGILPNFSALAEHGSYRRSTRERALAEEEAALALDPRHTRATALRAGLLLSMGRADEGVASLREAVRRDPANPTLVLELADLLADARQFGDAEAAYRQVVAAQPSNGRALVGLSVVLAATDRLDAALELLTRALEVDARDEEARLARAEVLAGLGRTDQARAEFEHLARTATRPDLRQAALTATRTLGPKGRLPR